MRALVFVVAMTAIYLADLGIYNDYADGPPPVETALSGGTDIRLWPTSGVEDYDLPSRGDYILFVNYSSTEYGTSELIGVGQAYETTQAPGAYEFLDEADIPYETDDSVLSIVNYEELEYSRRISDIVGEAAELARGSALRLIPDNIVEENDLSPPLRGLTQISGLSIESFEKSPRNPNPRGGSPGPEGYDDGGDDGIDRTGPLMEQQYTSRDAIREASKGGLQITILLFGVIVAGLSFLRDSLESGQVEISELMFLGAAAIATGAVFSTVVMVVTTYSPRPYITSIGDRQEEINQELLSPRNGNDSGLLIAFSDFYHRKVNQIHKSNLLLGGVTGAAVGTALTGIFLIGYEAVNQIEPIPPYIEVIMVLSMVAALVLIGYGIWHSLPEEAKAKLKR